MCFDVVEFQPVVVHRPPTLHSLSWTNCYYILWMWSVFNCFLLVSFLLI